MKKLKFIQAVAKGYIFRKRLKKSNAKSLIYKEKNLPFVKATLSPNQV
jgi:hypothetical protein